MQRVPAAPPHARALRARVLAHVVVVLGTMDVLLVRKSLVLLGVLPVDHDDPADGVVTLVERQAAALVAWNTVRVRTVALKKARAMTLCLHSGETRQHQDDDPTPGEVLAVTLGKQTDKTPCWKSSTDDEGNPEWIPMFEWCDPCLHRQVMHESYRADMRLRGALCRAMQRLAAVTA